VYAWFRQLSAILGNYCLLRGSKLLCALRLVLFPSSRYAGAEIPDDPEIDADLTGLQYGYSSKSQIQLDKEGRHEVARLSESRDMLAITFGVTVLPNPHYRIFA
jgi:hypothetical protein